MKLSYFCPTPFETPWRWLHKTKFFGIGKRASQKLAEKINELDSDYIIIFGSAGSLSASHRSGESYLISPLKEERYTIDLPLPKELLSLKRASLLTVSKPLISNSEKKEAHQKHRAELVDCEMATIWFSVKPSLRHKLIFARTVLDDADQSLFFLNREAFLNTIKSKSTIGEATKFISNYRKYLRGMNAWLTEFEARIET